MSDVTTTVITVETIVDAPMQKVWELWTSPEHIKNWNSASDEWHTPSAENDLRPGGKFLARMEAKDGSVGFDFTGEYTAVDAHKHIAYVIADGRKVNIHFAEHGESTKLIESFEAEDTHPLDVQMNGWQSILDNFKKYVEAHSNP